MFYLIASRIPLCKASPFYKTGSGKKNDSFFFKKKVVKRCLSPLPRATFYLFFNEVNHMSLLYSGWCFLDSKPKYEGKHIAESKLKDSYSRSRTFYHSSCFYLKKVPEKGDSILTANRVKKKKCAKDTWCVNKRFH